MRVHFRDGVELVLRDAECIGAATEGSISLEALRNTLGGNPLRETTHHRVMGKVPLTDDLGGALAQQLMLKAALESRRPRSDELRLRLCHQSASELQELLCVLRAGIA